MLNIFIWKNLKNYFKLQVPPDFDIIRTLDMFFKLHKIFNLNFDPHIKAMMVFLQSKAYHMALEKGYKRTTAVIQLSDYLDDKQ